MGVDVFIPSTALIAKIFPSKLVIGKHVIDFDIHGPITDFTVELNLEKGRVEWYLKCKEGFIAWHLYALDTTIVLELRRGPQEGVNTYYEKTICLEPRDKLTLDISKRFGAKKSFERLTCGISKKQEIEAIFSRKKIEEFLPFCFFVSQYAEQKVKKIEGGIADMILLAEEAILAKNRIQLSKIFEEMFSISFYDLFVPTLEDRMHQNVFKNKVKKGVIPFDLFGHWYHLIKKCFIDLKGSTLHLLPCLPKDIPCGTFSKIQFKDIEVDLSWRKQRVLKMAVFAKKQTVLTLDLPEKAKSFRLRKNLKEKGLIYPIHQAVSLEANTLYYLDRFTY